jgi:lipid-binding SYLF domain-containing protein
MKMRFGVSAVVILLLLSAFVWGNTKEERERLNECAQVAKEVLNIPEGIPQDLLDKAECIVVIPSVKKFALGFGGSYGKGAMVCRSGAQFDGSWGAPAMMRLEGGSFGLQIGGSATDFILLVMNPRGAKSLLSSKVKLGADASIAGGPKGRTASAETDALMTAEILSYSRSKGLFAGVSLEGSTLREDSGANEDLYGKEVSAKEIILEGKVKTPPEARALDQVLQKKSPRNKSE